MEIKEEELLKGAETGNTSVFKSLSSQQLYDSLSLRNDDARSLLHVASSFSHPHVVKILAEADALAGKMINSKDEEGWAPLHFAASIGNPKIVEILLSKGADVNMKNDGGRIPLHYAASKGWVKIAEILLSHGTNINAKDKVGCTPLHRAARTGNAELCELLIEEGAEIDALDKTDQNPLMNAVICENKEVSIESRCPLVLYSYSSRVQEPLFKIDMISLSLKCYKHLQNGKMSN
ncbi:hypothetical protein vseg_019892 [Gypsophila vaccaria]